MEKDGGDVSYKTYPDANAESSAAVRGIGSSGDPLNNGQNKSTLLGSIMRLNVDNQTEERNYSIPDYKKIGPPQCAKNSLVVGATYSDNNQIADFSSFGPLDDGRLKPDLCAPGDENGFGKGIYSTYQITGYQNLAGTSMASPVATGCAALLTECWKNYHSGANPAPAVVKAILINTTLDLGAPGPGFDTGYGLIQIVPALAAVEKAKIIESGISNGGSNKYSLFVPNTADYVRVTLVWSDPPASPLANPVLVNDLDLIEEDFVLHK